MTDSGHTRTSLVDSLGRYVRTPIVDAQSLIRQEYKEVDVERKAFQNLKDRIATIDTVSSSPNTPTIQTTTRHPNSKQVERLRRAYRETVMGVPHYEDTYGESLETHITAELSPELATGFRPEGSLFTDIYKRHLTDAISRAITQRREFCERIETEQNSLMNSQEDLTDILDSLDGIRIPGWYTTKFNNTLSELAEERQETIQACNQYSHIDGHGLFAYLYDSPEWTYPVLTAIGRLYRTVEYCEEHSHSAIPGKDHG